MKKKQLSIFLPSSLQFQKTEAGLLIHNRHIMRLFALLHFDLANDFLVNKFGQNQLLISEAQVQIRLDRLNRLQKAIQRLQHIQLLLIHHNNRAIQALLPFHSPPCPAPFLPISPSATHLLGIFADCVPQSHQRLGAGRFFFIFGAGSHSLGADPLVPGARPLGLAVAVGDADLAFFFLYEPNWRVFWRFY